MKIGRPCLVQRDGGLEYQVRVAWARGEDVLWFRVDRTHADLVSDRAEAALLALILPAMQQREDIHVEGSVSSQLLYNLSTPFQALMRTVLPGLSRVRIQATELIAPPPRAAGIAVGFSGGIDSYSVLADHHYGDPLPGYRLTHLFTTTSAPTADGANAFSVPATNGCGRRQSGSGCRS